jgi:hypothetical protein
MTFDDLTSYYGGNTLYGAARIRVNVENKAIVDNLCSWHLTIISDNGGGSTNNDEWEQLNLYGSGSATNPKISLIQIRVRNGCSTSPIDGTWQNFPLGTHLDILEIISPLLYPSVINAGSCNTNVNGPGSYLTNYNEYNFDIDLRVNPSFSHNPGIYQLNLIFHLEENSP